MLMKVNLTTLRMLVLLMLLPAATFCFTSASSFSSKFVLTPPIVADPPHYHFSYEDMDRMLQLIETYRNMKPFHATMDYGIKFYPEKNPTTGQLALVARACVVLPFDAVPLNLPGNYFAGKLVGENFFEDGFIKTFQQPPALANGAAQAYTFAVLFENQVQILLSGRDVVGVKAYQAVVDYRILVPPATTTIFYNLNLVGDVPGGGFGKGSQFFLAFPCPPFWRE